ncbi:MAG: excalibur calcium-binding domain-containing protein [Nocardioidaceae bacterium]
MNYSGACIPPSPPDHDCGQISAENFHVVGTDDQRFDADGDGIACET